MRNRRGRSTKVFTGRLASYQRNTISPLLPLTRHVLPVPLELSRDFGDDKVASLSKRKKFQDRSRWSCSSFASVGCLLSNISSCYFFICCHRNIYRSYIYGRKKQENYDSFAQLLLCFHYLIFDTLHWGSSHLPNPYWVLCWAPSSTVPLSR